MLAHRMKIVIPDSHEVLIRLPATLPPGDAEVIVLTEAGVPPRPLAQVNRWLDALADCPPETPVIHLEALRRENLYD